EVSATLIGDVLCSALNGHDAVRCGNGNAHHFPHGCYACAAEDTWIALSVPDERAWRGLSLTVGRGEWLDDRSLYAVPGRRQRSREIELGIPMWARQQDCEAAMLQLQSAEVPAAMAHNTGTLLRDPHLCARQFFQSVEHPEAGKQSLYGPIWR